MKTKIFPTWSEIYTAPQNNKLFPMLIFSILMGLLFLAIPQLLIEHELIEGLKWAIIAFLTYFILRMSIWLIQHLLQNRKITWY